MLTFKIQEIIFSGFLLALLNQSVEANATAVRSIPEESVMGDRGAIPTITVWSGAGVNISFIPTGGIIQKVWLDDPSRLTVDFDSPLCSGSSRCESGGARVIHLRRINPINFPQLPSTSSTLLTAIAIDGEEVKRYQFQIVYGQGSPQYSGITIVPERKVTPIASTYNEQEILQGLQVARDKGLISRTQGNEALDWRVRNFLALLKQEMSPIQASRTARVSLALIEKLASLGQTTVRASINYVPTSTTNATFPCLREVDNFVLSEAQPEKIFTFLSKAECLMPR
ncbi:MAG: hypothetical protein HC820_05115 [Hydrococcus sp. RM1_1_31]|nr:hypothetical protein [Hydrococcus sp. RM1_1_31]